MSQNQEVFTERQELLFNYFCYKLGTFSLENIAVAYFTTEKTVLSAFEELEELEPYVTEYGVKKVGDIFGSSKIRYRNSNSFYIVLDDKTIDYFIHSVFKYFGDSSNTVCIIVRKSKETRSLCVNIMTDKSTFTGLTANDTFIQDSSKNIKFYQLTKACGNIEVFLSKRTKKGNDKVITLYTDYTKQYIRKKLKEYDYIFFPDILHLACFEEAKLCLDNIYV